MVLEVIPVRSFKDLYSCPIDFIKKSTNKGQFQYLTRLKGASKGDLAVYNTISFTKIIINIISELPKHFTFFF